jgi:hypothetical protein
VLPVGAFHSFLIPFTNLQHRTAREARYSIPLSYIPYRAALAFCQRTIPNAGKKVFVSRSVLFRKIKSARVNALPSVALAYTVHLPARLRSDGCSLTAVHLFCFTHSLHPHSQLFNSLSLSCLNLPISFQIKEPDYAHINMKLYFVKLNIHDSSLKVQ